MRPAPPHPAVVPWVVLFAALLVVSPGGTDVAVAQPTLASGFHGHHGFRQHHFAPYPYPFSYHHYPYYPYYPPPHPRGPRVWGYRDSARRPRGFNRASETLRAVESPVPITEGPPAVRRAIPRGGADGFRMMLAREELPVFATYRIRVLESPAAR